MAGHLRDPQAFSTSFAGKHGIVAAISFTRGSVRCRVMRLGCTVSVTLAIGFTTSFQKKSDVHIELLPTSLMPASSPLCSQRFVASVTTLSTQKSYR